MTRSLLFHLPALCRLLGPCVAMLAIGWGMLPDAARAGGFYRVAECSPGHRATPDAVVEGSTPAYSASTSCESGNWLQVQSGAAAAAGAAKQWIYNAPAGTRIERFEAGYGLVGDASPDGNRSYLFVRRYGQAQQDNISVVGLGSTAGIYDSTLQNIGPFAAIGVGVFCSRESSSCNYAPEQFARMSNVSFVIEDLTPPGSPVVAGRAADGEWVGGTTQIAVGETDVGGGVYRTTVDVNGVQAISDTVCAPGQDAQGVVGSMTPCDPIELRNITLDTRSAPFDDGPGNAVRVCTHEFGFGAASSCTTRELRVDNTAPGSPADLAVAGGGEWHRDNGFDLTWSNPQQQHAPIAGASVRVTGPNGFDETTFHAGPNLESIEDVSVPAVGIYTASVFLRDEAGNESPQANASAQLKFDDTVPPKSQPEIANGWISRSELADGYETRWQRPPDEQVPPSGIAGYRVAIDGDPLTDPCAGAGDPRTCSLPLTEVGIASNSRVLRTGDVGEGTNWVHVVPVTGSGMRAAEVGRVPLKVDLTDPVVSVEGAAVGWIDHPVTVTARAEDPLSGMTDTDEFPDDLPPRTVLAVDDVVTEENDGEVSVDVAGDGIHRIEYWARDLAGNENDGAGANAPPGEAEVRIDATPPVVAFRSAQDPADPDRLEARATDGLSGVVAGTISVRRAGTSRWEELPTELRSGSLVARVDSDQMEQGVGYGFRAEAVDRAGNRTISTRREDGSEMTTVGPLRAVTDLVDLRVNGATRKKLRYGRPIKTTGRLRELSGDPVPGADVEIVETYAQGSSPAGRTTTVRTDSSGRFQARLSTGPSRSIEARYAGDLQRIGSASDRVRASVRSRISLRLPKRVRAGGRARFTGRVKAKGARLSHGGKAVEVQVRLGSRWKTVGRSLRTDAKGRFGLRYRFVASYTRPVRYRFRAFVLRERGWPYLPAVSATRSLTVVP